jgi:lipopolysaccharide export system protein LptA
MPAANDQILAALNTVNRKLDVLMSQQDELNTDVQALQQADVEIGQDTDALTAEIADLKAKVDAGQPVDLSGLDAIAASLKVKTDALHALVPAPPAA